MSCRPRGVQCPAGQAPGQAERAGEAPTGGIADFIEAVVQHTNQMVIISQTLL
ncbi:hypothetical protein PCLA_11r0076 [Pseudomonas citronellolis]|nr:hypothetical protein PCLA_11r0076 [Pseudomonas citronellolis]